MCVFNLREKKETLPRPDQAPRWRPIPLVELDRQAIEIVVARLHLREVESFDDPDFRTEQDVMCLDPVLVEAAHAQVIDAHGLHAAIDKILRAFLGDIDEVLVELGLLPAHGGVAGFEEQALALLEFQLFELGGLDRFLVLDLHEPRGADHGIPRQVVHGLVAVQEMQRGVHVRAGMRAEIDRRDVAHIALGGAGMHGHEGGRVARPAVHGVVQRDGDVDPGILFSHVWVRAYGCKWSA